MPHPAIRNHSRFAHEVALLADESGSPLVVPMLQATFAIGAAGVLRLIDEQPPITLGGSTWGSPGASSWRTEPQIAFCKPACDVVLIGHAHAPRPGTTRMAVGFRFGAIERQALVFGDRWLLRGRRVTEPTVFERMPLRYERAFGGWDRRADDPRDHRMEARNDVGLGFRDAALPVDPEVQWPNLEDPKQPLKRYGETPAPAGFGFVSPQWQPRARYAGTYDDAWTQSRMPLLPNDFDRRFFNAASPGLICAHPVAGNEPVSIVGATPEGRLDFALPEVGVPLFNVVLRGRERRSLKMTLDTVIVDTDERTLTLMWRTPLPLRNGIHDLVDAAFHLPDARAHALRRRARRRH